MKEQHVNAVMTMASTLLTAAMIAGAGCASSGGAARTTGFLSDYSRLTRVSDSSMRYQGAPSEVSGYRAFIVDPVEVRFTPKPGSDLKAEDLEHIAAYFRGALIEALSDPYEVVSTPGPGVARFRIAITDIEGSTWWLNVSPVTRATGTGAGSASVEAELVDSVSGEQLAALVETQGGSRIGFDGLTRMGDAKAIIDRWVKRIRTRLDELRG
jgi:hypothetical protein